MRPTLARIVAALLVPCLLLDSAFLSAETGAPWNPVVLADIRSHRFTCDAIVPEPCAGFAQRVARSGKLRDSKLRRAMQTPVRWLQHGPNHGPLPMSSQDWIPTMKQGIEDLEQVGIQLGDDLLRAFEKADAVTHENMTSLHKGDLELWNWRRLNLLLIGELFQAIAATEGAGGPAFRLEHQRPERAGEFHVLFESSQGVVQARISIRLEREAPILYVQLGLLGTTEHWFDEFRIGCDRLADLEHLWPHMDVGPRMRADSGWIDYWDTHISVALNPSTDRVTDVRDSLSSSLHRLNERISRMEGVANAEFVRAVADEPLGVDSDVGSVGQITPDGPPLPAVRQRHPWRPRSFQNGGDRKRRASMGQRMARNVAGRWSALRRRIGLAGTVLMGGIFVAAVLFILGGTAWNVVQDVRRPSVASYSSNSVQEVASPAGFPGSPADLSIGRKRGLLFLQGPVIVTTKFVPPWRMNFFGEIQNQSSPDVVPDLSHQANWMQSDLTHGGDPALLDGVDLEDFRRVLDEIELIGGPRNSELPNLATLYTRYQADVRRDTGELINMAGDVTFTGTIMNPNLYGPMAKKARNLQGEAVRLAVQDLKKALDLQEQARLLRILIRLAFVEMAEDCAHSIRTPGHWVRASLRAKNMEFYRTFAGSPAVFMKKYLQPFVADWIEMSREREKGYNAYVTKHKLTPELVRIAREKLETVQGFGRYWRRLEYHTAHPNMTDDQARFAVLSQSFLPGTVLYVMNGSQGEIPDELKRAPMKHLVLEFIRTKQAEGKLVVTSEGMIEIVRGQENKIARDLAPHEPRPPVIKPYKGLEKIPERPRLRKPGVPAAGPVLRSDWSLAMIFVGVWYEVPWVSAFGMVLLLLTMIAIIFKPREGSTRSPLFLESVLCRAA